MEYLVGWRGRHYSCVIWLWFVLLYCDPLLSETIVSVQYWNSLTALKGNYRECILSFYDRVTYCADIETFRRVISASSLNLNSNEGWFFMTVCDSHNLQYITHKSITFFWDIQSPKTDENPMVHLPKELAAAKIRVKIPLNLNFFPPLF